MMENLVAINDQDKVVKIESHISLGEGLPSSLRFLKKLNWESNHIVHTLTDENLFSFFPVYTLKKIAVIWKKNTISKHPHNLVVYNADATMHKIVTVPHFMNERVISDIKAISGDLGKFEVFGDIMEIDNCLYIEVYISAETFSVQYGKCRILEQRALDVETGEFHPTWSKGGQLW